MSVVLFKVSAKETEVEFFGLGIACHSFGDLDLKGIDTIFKDRQRSPKNLRDCILFLISFEYL